MSPPQSEEETTMEPIKEEEQEEHQQQQQPQSQEAIDQNQNPNPNPKPSIPASIASLRSLYLSLTDFLLPYRSLSQTLASISSTLDSHNRPPDTEIEAICRHSSPKLLRKYVVTNLQSPILLRSEISAALPLSRDPAELVLAAIGKFYVQGSRAFERGGDVNLINFRRAAIMLLEIYVSAGCPVGEVGLREEVKESAREAAVAWRGRLISEGGVEKASENDALGLVLLVGAFGVPPQFKAKDLWGLVKVCGRRKGDVLRKSTILMKKMSGMINVLDVFNLKNKISNYIFF